MLLLLEEEEEEGIPSQHEIRRTERVGGQKKIQQCVLGSVVDLTFDEGP